MNLSLLAAIWSWSAIIVGVVGYAYYFKDVARSEISPNRWSWLIWSAATLIEALTYDEVSGDLLKSAIFGASAICCWLITALIWARSVWQWPNQTELACVAASAVAMVVWLVFEEAYLAHMIMVIALPIAFIPTWRTAYAEPSKEMTRAWMIWSIGDFIALTLIVHRLESVEELPFILMELACHATIWITVMSRARVVPVAKGRS